MFHQVPCYSNNIVLQSPALLGALPTGLDWSDSHLPYKLQQLDNTRWRRFLMGQMLSPGRGSTVAVKSK